MTEVQIPILTISSVRAKRPEAGKNASILINAELQNKDDTKVKKDAYSKFDEDQKNKFARVVVSNYGHIRNNMKMSIKWQRIAEVLKVHISFQDFTNLNPTALQKAWSRMKNEVEQAVHNQKSNLSGLPTNKEEWFLTLEAILENEFNKANQKSIEVEKDRRKQQRAIQIQTEGIEKQIGYKPFSSTSNQALLPNSLKSKIKDNQISPQSVSSSSSVLSLTSVDNLENSDQEIDF
jgi:hypothetical protein